MPARIAAAASGSRGMKRQIGREMIRRRVQVDARQLGGEHLARRLAQQSGSVPGPAVGRARAAMDHRGNRFQRERDGMMRAPARRDPR